MHSNRVLLHYNYQTCLKLNKETILKVIPEKKKNCWFINLKKG